MTLKKLKQETSLLFEMNALRVRVKARTGRYKILDLIIRRFCAQYDGAFMWTPKNYI